VFTVMGPLFEWFLPTPGTQRCAGDGARSVGRYDQVYLSGHRAASSLSWQWDATRQPFEDEARLNVI
jgi:hypothetical protein